MAAQVEPRRAGEFLHAFVGAHRAFDQSARQLALEIVFGRKPAFKRMLVRTLEIQDFHGRIIAA
jgi:hypothetical protein